jgi:RNA polymerase sigma factor (sigma-70 family)
MDDRARWEWIAAHILICESEVRGWLRKNVRTLSPEDIDDVLQEAYARLWSASADVSQIRNGRAYFYTIVRRLLLEQARRARIIPMERIGEIESLHIISSEPGPERLASARQVLEQVRHIVTNLPPRMRRAFELQNFTGLSQREIAQTMGISEKTVEIHLTKAIARIVEAIGTAPAPVGEAETTLGIHEHEVDQQED